MTSSRKKCGRACRAQLGANQGDEAPPFVSRRERTAFDARVDETLRANGFEPSLSPLAEKWVRSGHRTVLIARIHGWSPHLVEFYLEGKGEGFPGDTERLIEAGRSDERTFKSVLFKFLKMQRENEAPTGLGNGAQYAQRTETFQLIGVGTQIGAPFKTCTRCNLSLTRGEWDALPIIGHQRMEGDDGSKEQTLELRNCPKCGSTLAVEVDGGNKALSAYEPSPDNRSHYFITSAEKFLRGHGFVPMPMRARNARFWAFTSDHFRLGVYLWTNGAEIWLWRFLSDSDPSGSMAIVETGEVQPHAFENAVGAMLVRLDDLETHWEPR